MELRAGRKCMMFTSGVLCWVFLELSFPNVEKINKNCKNKFENAEFELYFLVKQKHHKMFDIC